MRNLLFGYLFLFLLSSCGEPSHSFTVDRLTTFPGDSIDVGCFFREQNGSDLVFASGADSIAYVSINGSAVEFRLVHREEKNVNDSSTDFTEIYNHKEYELNIEMKQIGGFEEGGSYMGIMTVKDNKGARIIKKIMGECGC